MEKDDLVFNLFSDCLPVKGNKRSIICDLGRNNFKIIPNSLYYILTRFKGKTINTIKNKFNHRYDEFIDEYFLFLVNQEFGQFITKSELKRFPKLKLEFDHPSVITNAIIDINKNSKHNYKRICADLATLRCHYWQFRFYDNFDIPTIHKILLNTTTYHIRSLHLIIKYDPAFTFQEIKKLYECFPIARIDFYSTPKDNSKIIEKRYQEYPIYFLDTEIKNETSCGKIKPDYFQVNIQNVSESMSYNSCLNRKISIDTEGNIKNCPSMKNSFGNINNTTLSDAINKNGFKDVWNITKDKIDICKTCEFRYICTDCRAYTDNPEDIYSKPLKCGYNPYTATWEKWSTNPLKQKAMDYYGMHKLNEM